MTVRRGDTISDEAFVVDSPYDVYDEVVENSTSSLFYGRLAAAAATAAASTEGGDDGTVFVVTGDGDDDDDVGEMTLFKLVTVSIVVTILCLMTSGGNLMVMISFKMDRQLQTVSRIQLLGQLCYS